MFLNLFYFARQELELPPAATESEALAELKAMASKNTLAKSMIGMGYYDTLTPGVIARNILENPGAYTHDCTQTATSSTACSS